MKKLTAILITAVMFVFSGCTAGYITPWAGDSISPVEDSSVSSAVTVIPLYYRYYNEPMLLCVPINIEISQQQQAEYYALQALLSSANTQSEEITPCFETKKGRTEIVNFESNKENLYLTLSKNFIENTLGATPDATRQNRKLAIYSLVNTVCEMGTYTRVQIYISDGNEAYRPDSYEMGISANKNEASPLGPLTRDTSLILTPSNVVKTAFSHYSSLEWDKLYYYLCDKEDAIKKLPMREEMAEKLKYDDLVMTEYSVEDNYTVSSDGKSAIVQISFSIRSNGAAYTVKGYPLELAFGGRSWRICYESLMRALEVSG